jgi:CheY-like chemotaxis protein
LPVLIANPHDMSFDEDWSPIKSLAPQQPAWRLLVVDNHADNCLMLFKTLTEVGFQVREATNAEEAVSLFEQWQPHLIWIDTQVLDAYQAIAHIHQLSGGDQVKIIAMSASALNEDHQKSILAGADAVLHKPFYAPELFATLMSCLNVKFIYRDIPEIEASPKQKITVENLMTLPLELRQRLHEAALNLDMEETEIIVLQIRQINPSIADGLQELAQYYQFGQIISLSEAVNNCNF